MNRIEAQQAIHDALAPIIHLMGPRTCEHGEWGGDEECECLYEDTIHTRGLLLEGLISWI